MKQSYINSMFKRLCKPTYVKIVNVYRYPGARQHKFDTLQYKLNDYNKYTQYPGPRRNKYNNNDKKNDDKKNDNIQNKKYPGARFSKKDMDVDEFDYDIEYIMRNGGL